MPTSVINEILSFCPQGTIASGDIMALEDYKNDVQRLRGHQPGIARRELENMALRQSSFVAAGLAQFVAKRYVPGVRDDADLDALETAITAAITALIAAGNAQTATRLATKRTIGGVAFNFMLPILAGYIAMSIADRPGLVVGFVGGSMAAAGTSFATIAGTADPVSSGFLGALLAGFVGGYFMLAFEKLCEKLPRSLEGIKPILLYPVVGVLFMGLFMCAFGPIVGALNTGLTGFLSSLGGTSKILLGAVLGGMMSIDMGGPFNKAAYVTGTGAIATALAAGAGQGAIEYQMMASVMVGGMVPPIAIALCTTFFKKKFTADERKSGVVNYIMGLCFISEGAIPFAAADPLRVIPSCVVGSAVAGALSMVFGCGLMAPHGGIFVFPVVSNVMGYLLSLVAGSVVGMALLAVLKKNKEA